MSPTFSGNSESKTAGTSLSVLWSIDDQGYLGSTARFHQLRNPRKIFVFFLRQKQGSGRDILLEMLDRGSPWDGQHDGGSPQEPRQRYLCRTRTVRLRNLAQHFASIFTCSQREPRNKRNSIALTIIDHVVPFAVGKAIAVLHGDNRDDFACSLDVFLRNVRQRDQANLAFASKLSQRF